MKSISTPQTTNKLKISGLLALLLAASVTLTACGGGGAVSGGDGAVNGGDAVSGGETPVPDGGDAVSGGETPVPDGGDAVSGGETPVPDGGDAVSGGETPVPGSGGGVASVNNELLTASATPAALTAMQTAADSNPLHGSVSQLSYGTRTFEVIPFIHEGELSYKTERKSINRDTGAVFDHPRHYDSKFFKNRPDLGSDTFSTTRFAKDGAFRHVGLKYEYVDERHNGEYSQTAYIDVFTDYDLTEAGGDADYLVGGIWLWTPKLDGTEAWIGASASGNDPFGNASGMGIADVTGSATYRGKAHGIVSVDNVGIENDDTIAITFDADVALTAEFGDDSTGGMISGTVSDFESSDAEFNFDGTDDTINLKPAPISGINSGFFTGSTDYVQVSVNEDGTTDIDPIENVGKWGGQFYGNGEDQPGSVAGTFGVTHGGSQPDDSTISFLGVFGAYKSDETPVPGSGGGVASVNNELLTALATPAALTEMQTAANNNPLYGSVSQLSDGTRTFEVIPFIHEGELSYKTERKRINQDTGEVVDRTRYYDLLKFYPDYRGSDTVSTTRFAKDGAFRHVGLKFEYADARHNGEYSETAYIDVFTDYDLTEAGGDTDYLVGGIWLWAPGSEASRAGTWVGVSASGNDPFGDSSGMGIAAVTGSATYSGRAHGISSSDEADVGSISFDADVALTAEFGDNSTGGMISGRVFNLEVSDRPKCEDDCGSGTIILKAAPIGDINSGFFTGSTDLVVSSVSSDGTTEIDTTENVGKWGGQFYGNTMDDATAHPGSVAGTFGVSFGDSSGSLLGVFGAHKDEE